MQWGKGRGLLGPLKPLIGEWVTSSSQDGSGQGGPAAAMRCMRKFAALGKDWVELEAVWRVAPGKDYRERALFGAGDDGALACFSFTSDGKRSLGRLADGGDVDPSAIAFEVEMPAGLARMIYWPRDDGRPGFRFAVESRTKKGWNRFLVQTFEPAP